MIRFNNENDCWGISSIDQKVINFKKNFKKEPLVLEIGSGKGELLDKIIQIYGLKNFYITTNASLMDKDYCKKLYNAGLRKLHVSIGAETNHKYRKYARPVCSEINLDYIL